jgi:phosphatidylethanolamine/phosphatidyl-N-methylethanolamine N-methyltransferase
MPKTNRATDRVLKRYNHIAPVYDFFMGRVEGSRFGDWRRLLWDKVEGKRILEVGVGTGMNLPYYPADADITAIDFSEKMLARARPKTEKQNVKVDLLRMDVQKLDFPDNSFDTVIGSLQRLDGS